MKTILILLLSFMTISSFAQIASTWKGKTPGHETDWNWPSNWTNNSQPDEFTDVIIPLDNTLSGNYPVIKAKKIEINSLNIFPGASLVMLKGELSILDPEKSVFEKNQVVRKIKAGKSKEANYIIDDVTTVKADKAYKE